MTEAHTQRAHAKLSPSASHRWMQCSGSIRMSEGIENKSSFYADEGTAAHHLCATCLEEDREPEHYLGKYVCIDAEYEAHRYSDKPPATGRSFEVDDEMVDAVKLYIDYVRGLVTDGAELDVEFRFDLQHVADGMFGTGDAVVYNPATKGLHVVDFKYGRGVPVEPKENSQLLTYGLGAVRRHHNRGLGDVTLTVVQPRCRHPKGPVREWPTNAVGLIDFEHDLREAAAATGRPDAPLKAGEWCKFCPAAATCVENRNNALRIAALEFEEPGFDLATILGQVSTVAAWCKRVLEYAHERAVAGNMPKGWKLVEKRAIRRWKDPENIAATLATVYELDEDDIYAPREVSTPAQIEKHMPGKNKDARAAVLKPLVVKQSSGAVLVPEHDARPPVKADGSEFLEAAE